MTKEDIEKEIIDWHKTRTDSLKDRIKLGELLHNYMLLTRMSRVRLHNAIVELLGKGCSFSYYTNAMRFDREFTSIQKRILVKAGLPVNMATFLLSKNYTPRQRTQAISEIKDGKMTAPWEHIKTRIKRRENNKYIDQMLEQGFKNYDPLKIRVKDYVICSVIRKIVKACGLKRASTIWERCISECANFERLEVETEREAVA